eukprot:COSAG01_NODE_7516_length_3172_cov_2.105434_1_plen_91_part_00
MCESVLLLLAAAAAAGPPELDKQPRHCFWLLCTVGWDLHHVLAGACCVQVPRRGDGSAASGWAYVTTTLRKLVSVAGPGWAPHVRKRSRS